MSVDVLFFAEDPGAANYIAQMPKALSGKKIKSLLITDGIATAYLKNRGITCEHITKPDNAVFILDAYQPRIVIVGTTGNPNTWGLELIAAAKSMGITSVGIIDLPMNANRRFRGNSNNSLAYAPDFLFVPDFWTGSCFTSMGYPSQNVIVCGHPHYDYIWSIEAKLKETERAVVRRQVLPDLTDQRKVVVFATEGSVKLLPSDVNRYSEFLMKGWGGSTGRTEIVIEEFLSAVDQLDTKPYLVLRLHPKDSLEAYQQYLNYFDFVSHAGSPLELLYAADLIVGSTTMLMVEAAILGINTMSILLRREEKDWLPSIRAGITPFVSDQKETLKQLRAMLSSSYAKQLDLAKKTFPRDSLDTATSILADMVLS